jgi:hypothetical protein
MGFIDLFSAPYSHHKLAKMERQWCTHTDSATTMMRHNNAAPSHWGRAMRVVVYLRNRPPTHAASGCKGDVPYTLLYGHKASMSRLTKFACTVYLLVNDARMGKL